MKKHILFIIFLLFIFHLFSQTNIKTDSLETVFEKTENDSLKNSTLNELFTEYLKYDWGLAINTAKNGIAYFSEKNSEYTVSWYQKLGHIYMEKGFYTLSLDAYNEALKISDNNDKNNAYILLDIAKLYYLQNKFDRSIEIYNNALSEFEKLKNKNPKESELGIAKTYNKLGIVYELKNEFVLSKKYFYKALKLREKHKEAKNIIDSYTSLGYFSNVIQEYDSALYYFSKGTEICKSSGNMYYFIDLHLFRSTSFSKLKDFNSSSADIDTAKQFALQNKKSDLARIYYFYAKNEKERGNYEQFLNVSKTALQYADSFNILSVENKVLKLLVSEAEKHNDFNTAYKSQKQLTDNLQLTDTENLIKLEQSFELQTKKRQNLELSQVNKGLEQKVNLFQLLLISGILIFIFLVISLIFNSRKNNRIKKALQIAEEEKNKAEETKKELENSTELIRSQAALSEILRNVTGKERSIEKFMQDALNKLLALPWLNIVSKGSIFLTDEDGNLKMVAEKDLGEVAVRCALIKPGECLCGKALSEKKIQFCNHIDHNHEIRFKNMTEHGHYNLPIMMQDKVLGVLNLYTQHNHKKNDNEVKFLQMTADTLASVIYRKKSQNEILQAKNELEKKNKNVRLYLTQLEQKNKESEILNQTILSQKKAVEKTKKQLEEKAKEQESVNQKLFAQKLEVEQRNIEVEKFSEQLKEKAKEQEALNQKLFAQKLEVEQRNTEVEQYLKQIEEQKKEQEALNQKLFSTNLEAEQRNAEVELYAKQLEEKAKEQESVNQKLFAQKLEVEQRNIEVKQFSEELKEKAKEQEALNQKLFAQKLEVEQRNFEVEQYLKQIEEQKKEQDSLNQKLFAQKLEVEQRNFEVEQYLKQIEEQKKEQDSLNQKLFAQKLEVEQRNFEVEQYLKEIETLKEKAEGALNHINDSINYSKFIQDTLLPDKKYIQQLISSDFFIYFKPKEIIGGDFYYAKKVNDYAIFAVADCTGHGIPGALITMLGISLLNDIMERSVTETTTGIALNTLRSNIKKTFMSESNSIENKNGLDIALCAVNLKTNKMQYSGAFNPLIIMRNNELKEYKATRNPIGYYPVEKDFETTEIQLQKDDVIYLFSDGYLDQIGGENNRKFSKRQFKTLLGEIHNYPMKKQEIFIEKIMKKWTGNNSQVDDITVMGIKWENEI